MEFVMPILEGAWRYVLTLRVSDYLDIALMAYAIYWLLKLVGTSKVESVGKVILLFLLALMLSDAFSLNGIYFLLSHILSLGALALMHDGAVIMRDGRLLAGGCMLPLSKNVNLSRDLGMRHRAGIGMSENSDAVVVIVSEETGTISVAIGGLLKRHLMPETLEKLLINELVPQEPTEQDDKLHMKLLKLLSAGKGDKDDEK